MTSGSTVVATAAHQPRLMDSIANRAMESEPVPTGVATDMAPSHGINVNRRNSSDLYALR